MMDVCDYHCVKSVRIRSYSGPYFPTFGLNTDRYSVSVRMRENMDQNNSEYEHFLRSVYVCFREIVETWNNMICEKMFFEFSIFSISTSNFYRSNVKPIDV